MLNLFSWSCFNILMFQIIYIEKRQGIQFQKHIRRIKHGICGDFIILQSGSEIFVISCLIERFSLVEAQFKIDFVLRMPGKKANG